MTAISEWSSDVPAEVLAALGTWADRQGLRVVPSRSAFRRVLRQLDAQAVAAAFGTWLKAQVMAGLADAEAVIIALDGKTVRGARACGPSALLLHGRNLLWHLYFFHGVEH